MASTGILASVATTRRHEQQRYCRVVRKVLLFCLLLSAAFERAIYQRIEFQEH